MRQLTGWIVLLMATSSTHAAEVLIQWREGAPSPRPKGGAATGWVDGRLILAGGTWWEGVPEEPSQTPIPGPSPASQGKGGAGNQEEVKHWISTVHAYDPQTDTWDTLPDLPHPVGYGVGAVVGGTFYVLGGAEGEQSFTDCFRLARKGDKPTAAERLEQEEAQREGTEGDGGERKRTEGDGGERKRTEEEGKPDQPANPPANPPTAPEVRYLWQTIPPLPEPRVYAGVGVMGDTLYLVGGSRDPNDLTTVSNSLWSIQPDQPHTGWQTLPPLPGPPRAGMATAVCANRLFVFGGFHLDGQGQIENLADAYLYTPTLRKWQRLADTPLPVEGWQAEVVQNHYILLCGGYTTVALSPAGPVAGFVPDVLVYDVRTNKYTYSTPMPHALMDAQPVLVGDTLYLAGGEDRPRHRAPWTMIGTVQVR